MKLFQVTVLLFAFFIFYGCGEKAEEVKQSVENLKNLSESGSKMDEMIKHNEELRAERVKRGDTLAMDYKLLQKYLPSSISGFTAKEPEGSSLNVGLGSFSSAMRHYVKGDGENGQDIEISIYDYNSAADIYSGVFAVWNMGYSFENDKEYVKSLDLGIKDVQGFEKLDKKNSVAEITLGVAGRFIVTLKGTNQSNTDFLKDVAKSIALGDLAKK